MRQADEWTTATKRVYAVRVIAEAIRGDLVLSMPEDLQHHINISQAMTDKDCEDLCATNDPQEMFRIGQSVKAIVRLQYKEVHR